MSMYREQSVLRKDLPSPLSAEMYGKTYKAFFVLSQSSTVYVIERLTQDRYLGAKQLVTQEYKYHTILKVLRQLRSLGLVHMENLAGDITYRLHYDRLEAINRAVRIVVGS